MRYALTLIAAASVALAAPRPLELADPMPTVSKPVKGSEAPIIPLPIPIHSSSESVIPLPTPVHSSSESPVIPLPSVVHPVVDPPKSSEAPVIDPPTVIDRPVIDPPVIPLPSPVPSCVADRPSAIVKAEERYGHPGSGKNTTLILPLDELTTRPDVLSHVSKLHLAGAVHANEQAVFCQAYVDIHGRKQMGKPFVANEPLHISSGAGYVGSVKCMTKQAR